MNSLLILFLVPHLAWLTDEQRYEDQTPPPPPTEGQVPDKLPLHAPGRTPDLQTETTQVAIQWLALLDGKQWGASWLGGSSLLRDVVTQNQWIDAIKAQRDSLGNATSRKLESMQKAKNLRYGTRGDFIILKFNTSFSNSPHSTETLTLMSDGRLKQWKVTNYEIRKQR